MLRALGHTAREPHEQLVGRGDLRIVVVCRGHVLEYELVVLVGPEPVADVEAIVDLFEEGQAGFDGGLAALGARVSRQRVHESAHMEVLLREAALGDGVEDAFDFGEFVVGVQVRRHAHRGLVVARECAEQKALSMARAFEVLDRFECAGGTGGIVVALSDG
ncbi:MAG: hypothetical protein ACLTKG_04775 [Collinsella intestinalis]